MSLIFLKEKSSAPLESEPYSLLHERLDVSGNELDGHSFEIIIPNIDQTICDGFYNDAYYACNFVLRFFFAKNMNSKSVSDEFMVRHSLSFEFDHEFKDIEEDTLGEICARTKYIYLVGASYYEYSYNVTYQNKAEMFFDVLTGKGNIEEICRQLISYDIAFFARGY